MMLRLAKLSWMAALVGFVAMFGNAGWAQETSPEETGVEYADSVDVSEFGPAPEGSTAARVSAPLLVSIAYGLIWLLVSLFIFVIWRRTRVLMADVSAVRSRLSALDKDLGALLDKTGEEP